jgi:hypothetical protein
MDNENLHIDHDDVLRLVFGELDDIREAEMREVVLTNAELLDAVRRRGDVVASIRDENPGCVSDDFESRLWLRTLALEEETNGDEFARVNRLFVDNRNVVHPISIVVGESKPSRKSQSPVAYLFKTGPLSYLASALIMCIALLLAWQYEMRQPKDSSSTCDGSRSLAAASQADGSAPVGHVTAMADCLLGAEPPGDGRAATPSLYHLTRESPISPNKTIVLDAGLLEITYETGARVILEGPATFEPDANGGLLIVGKLTGRCGKKVQTSTVSKSTATTIANPQFTIRTPTAIVTNLGTEFGVEVEKDGRTLSHVFSGTVVLRPVFTSDDSLLVLKENDSAQVESGRESPTIRRVHIAQDRFVRQVGKNRRIALRVFGTGIGVPVGQPDPHWQVTAVSTDRNFQPRGAVVCKVGKEWPENDSKTSQWVSLGVFGYNQPIPKSAVCTFCTRFDLDGLNPQTARLSGWCLADSIVRAIRINGCDVAAPPPNPKEHSFFQRVEINQGFVQGENVLEFDVEAGEVPPRSVEELRRLGFRIELTGSAKPQ